jgi:hypothetical protein
MTNNAELIVSLLREAIGCIHSGEHKRAAWRVADAGGRLRKLLDRDTGNERVAGYTEPTGIGCELPKMDP